MTARGTAFSSGGFGDVPKGCNANRFRALPEVMQAEGIAFLREMRLSDEDVQHRLRLDEDEFRYLTNVKFVPFRRGGELTLAGDHE
jgi:hypothetical protein